MYLKGIQKLTLNDRKKNYNPKKTLGNTSKNVIIHT